MIAETAQAAEMGHGVSGVLLALASILLAARIGAHIASRLGQPEVLGELVVGVLLGNLALFGLPQISFLHDNQTIKVLSELGVILLLFDIGLETNVKDMLKVGKVSLIVAVLGVVFPFAFGWGVSSWFMPQAHVLAHVFVGATLCATSVGITARVLKDLGKLQTVETRIILGAAVLDDVLGLLILAIVTSMIQAANAGMTLEISAISAKFGIALGFLAVAVGAGSLIAPKVFGAANKLQSQGVLLAVGLVFCFGFAYVAAAVGLAPIVGAFAAGLVLEPAHYRDLSLRHNEIQLEELIAPIVSLLVPIFFVSMGAHVGLSELGDPKILGFAAALIVAAIAGKQACSLGTLRSEADNLLVGFGMIPRGEVGLIFAGIGFSLSIAGQPIVDRAAFGAIVLMVIVTTMLTPPLIKWRYSRLLPAAQRGSE